MSYKWLCRPNASSGMGVADQSKNAFMELQRKTVRRYVIFKVDKKKREILVEKTGGPAENYDNFTAALPENDCRYAVYDFDFVTPENCQKIKIFFIACEFIPRCSMPHPRIGLEGSLMASTMRFKQLILQKWILKCLENGQTELVSSV